MVKYSFYSLSLRKFEKGQMEEVEVSNILTDYMKKKAEVKGNISNEELMRLIDMKQKEYYLKACQFDDLLEEDQMKEIDESFKKNGGNKENEKN